MNYYIDSRYGNDANDGLSRQTAFRSVEKMSEIMLNGGDTVLLKAGTEYVGSLHLKRNRDGGIIKIDRYGVGEKPIINGIGKSPVLLENFDYVEIESLDDGVVYISTGKGSGKDREVKDVFAYNLDFGTITHIADISKLN